MLAPRPEHLSYNFKHRLIEKRLGKHVCHCSFPSQEPREVTSENTGLT